MILVFTAAALAAEVAGGLSLGDGLGADLRLRVGPARVEATAGVLLAQQTWGGSAAAESSSLGAVGGLWFGRDVVSAEPVALQGLVGLRGAMRRGELQGDLGVVPERGSELSWVVGAGVEVRHGPLLVGLDLGVPVLAWARSEREAYEGTSTERTLVLGPRTALARLTLAARTQER